MDKAFNYYVLDGVSRHAALQWSSNADGSRVCTGFTMINAADLCAFAADVDRNVVVNFLGQPARKELSVRIMPPGAAAANMAGLSADAVAISLQRPETIAAGRSLTVRTINVTTIDTHFLKRVLDDKNVLRVLLRTPANLSIVSVKPGSAACRAPPTRQQRRSLQKRNGFNRTHASAVKVRLRRQARK
jgi:hypothetical protein